MSRPAEHIPPDEELRGWMSTGKGLPRNLLAVLVAHTKNDLYTRVLASRIPDLPLFHPFLISYFPPKLAEKYKEQIGKHQLRREIIATVVTNAIINQAGTTLLVQLCKETSLPIEELVVRYFVIDELLDGRAFRAAVHAADFKVAAADQYNALLSFEEVHRNLMRWWLWNERSWKLAPEDVARVKPQFDAATKSLVASLEEPARLAHQVREQELTARGFSPQVAAHLARAPQLKEAFALMAAAQEAKVSLDVAAPLMQRVGRELHVDTFDELLSAQVPANAWERRFHSSLEREAAAVRMQAVGKLAKDKEYVEKNREHIDKVGDSLRVVKSLGGHGLVPLFLILEDYRTPW